MPRGTIAGTGGRSGLLEIPLSIHHPFGFTGNLRTCTLKASVGLGLDVDGFGFDSRVMGLASTQCSVDDRSGVGWDVGMHFKVFSDKHGVGFIIRPALERVHLNVHGDGPHFTSWGWSLLVSIGPWGGK